MPDFEGIIKNINAVFQLVFGKNIPPWLSFLTARILFGALFLCAIWGLLFILSKIKDIWVQSFKPLFYKPEQKRLCRRRQSFAKHIEYEILRLDLLEDWKDDQFAELEAEVEAEGRRKIFSFIPFFHSTREGLRRERSLSRALASSQARFVLVEGEPGSGKSVALRHVAQKMAAQAKKSRSLKSVIPIYVNLKELERANNEPIDRNLIESFVRKTLTRSNDRDVERFLDEQFASGVENGTWFFIFDSFDELPEILSSIEADMVIRNYGDAIADFLQGGINTCRGIIASRQFRGPKQFGWPRFRILALTEDRRLELIHKADFEPRSQNEFIEQLDAASQEIRFMASNPLFLALLCEHVKNGHPFPKNTHTVFETYIESRLKRDETRLQRRYGLSTSEIRSCAENIAYCIASDTGLGLSPSREALYVTMKQMNMEIPESLDTFLDALEYTKLARPGTGTSIDQPKIFTFAHRRFQEYFATCVVLRDPTQALPADLLSNSRWRETAVTMCQTQPPKMLTTLIEQAERSLITFCSNVPDLIDDAVKYIENKEKGKKTLLASSPPKFPWPAGSLHLLSLLQEGFTSHMQDLPHSIRDLASRLILSASEMGGPDDRKWALEIAGIAPEPVLSYLLEQSFSSKSLWLREVAYRQASRLGSMPPDIVSSIYEAIIELMLSGRLRKEKYATRAHLSRLHQSLKFLSAMGLLLYLPTIDILWSILYLVGLLIIATKLNQPESLGAILWATILIVGLYIILWHSPVFRRAREVRPYTESIGIIAFIIYVRILIVLYMFTSFPPLINNSLILSFLAKMIIIFSGVAFIITVPSALWAVSTNRVKHWFLWIFVPFYPLSPIIRYMQILLSQIDYSQVNLDYPKMNLDYSQVNLKLLMDPKFYKRILQIIISLIGIILVFKLVLQIIDVVTAFFNKVGSFLRSLSISIFLYNTYNTYRIEIGSILVLLPVLIIICAFHNEITNLFDDWKLWRAWSKKSKNVLTYREFWKAVNSYHIIRYRIKMIRYIREEEVLIANEKAERFLRKLVWETEKRQTQLKKSKSDNSNSEKRKKVPERYKTISWINDAAYDEICKLMENTRISSEGDIRTLENDLL